MVELEKKVYQTAQVVRIEYMSYHQVSLIKYRSAAAGSS